MSPVRAVAVAGDRVNEGLLWRGIRAYAASHQPVLRYYDEVADRDPQPAPHIDARALGRVLFVDRSVTAEEAAQLIEADIGALVDAIPIEATLAEADPAIDDGLYDDAERPHRCLIDINRRVSPTVVSAALALLRPGLFPLLTVPIRGLYRDVAELAWQVSDKARRPDSKRTYWPVIRDDVMEGADALAEWRARLAASEVDPERWLARVSDVRLWGIAASALTASHAG